MASSMVVLTRKDECLKTLNMSRFSGRT